jgi:hypothetical protein
MSQMFPLPVPNRRITVTPQSRPVAAEHHRAIPALGFAGSSTAGGGYLGRHRVPRAPGALPLNVPPTGTAFDFFVFSTACAQEARSLPPALAFPPRPTPGANTTLNPGRHETPVVSSTSGAWRRLASR